MTQPAAQLAGKLAVAQWNADVPIGAPVRYWTGAREGEPKTGLTRTRAHLLGGHTPVVWINGQASCVALTHVEPTNAGQVTR